MSRAQGQCLLALCLCLTLFSCQSFKSRPAHVLQLPVNAFPPLLASHSPASSAYRHIYLEGDGTPWLPAMVGHEGGWQRSHKPAPIPRVEKPVAQQLMQLDVADALYLQRPCYGYSDGYVDAKASLQCSAQWWTSHRYSTAIVAALSQALDSAQETLGAKPLVLIGHSGGGALAMLLAAERSDVAAVVTVAGNLDHRAWTQVKGYLSLEGSLNVAEQPLLPEEIIRWHLVGERDRVILPKFTVAAIQQDAHARKFGYPFDHNCCWHQVWPDVLAELYSPPNLPSN